MFLFWDGSANASVRLAMARIEAVITDHFEVLFWDVADELFDKVHGRNGFVDKDIVLVSIVMEGNGVCSLIVGIDARSSNHRAAEIAADIIQDSGGIALAAFCINVETVFCVAVNEGFQPFEFRRKLFLEEIQKNRLEGVAEKRIVEVSNRAPKAEFIDAAFGDKAMNMGIPL